MTYMLILLAVALAASSIGWKYFIYFFSTGYGFSIAALAITIAIMFSGARRLELRQMETYGQDTQFQAYVRKTPILLPIIPLYSVAKYKWLQA